MNKKLKIRLRKSLQMTPDIDTGHLAETSGKVRAALAGTEPARPISFGAFMLRQIWLSGYKAWLWQGLCLVLQCLWLDWYFSGNTSVGYSAQFGFALCVFGGMTVLAGIPYLERSWNYRMQEIEISCFYSLPRLLLARMLVIGLGSLPCIGALCLLMSRWVASAGTILASSVAFLTLSYLLAALGCVFIIDHLHGRGATSFCYVWAITVSAGLVLLWTQLPAIDITWILPALCACVLVLLLWEVTAFLKHTKTLDAMPARL